MRAVVTGSNGQLALSLRERAAARGIEVLFVARPHVDFARLGTIGPALRATPGDIIINAAAYTAVDQAENDEATATRVNAEAAGEVAAHAHAAGVPVIQISTDYVFDGALDRPYLEDDAVAPINAYGRSKLAGEVAVAKSTDNHVILRTSWIYSPFGRNFVRSMLALGLRRDVVSVVADQIGNPTYALDIADGLLRVAHALVHSPRDDRLRGVFHMPGGGEASWADLAQATFQAAESIGRAPVAVTRIASAEYPTPARRPLNSRLDGGKLKRVFGVALPQWPESLRLCVGRLLQDEVKGVGR